MRKACCAIFYDVNEVTLGFSPTDRLKTVFSPNGKFETTPASTHDDEPRERFCHPHALVDAGTTIGKGTRIWAFSHVVTGAIIGDDCNVCDHTFIEGGVRIGNRVTLKCGVYLWNGITVEDDVFIGPAAVFTNDCRPRSKRYLADLKTVLKEGCSIGANSTVLPDLTIGRWAMVGAGSVVTHSVPDHALVVGNPARWRAWICRCGEKLHAAFGRVMKCDCGKSLRHQRPYEPRLTLGLDWQNKWLWLCENSFSVAVGRFIKSHEPPPV
jgi:acetyltransferase-like isoleucine patch superfamily enzyme